jgi:hypothetical protein
MLFPAFVSDTQGKSLIMKGEKSHFESEPTINFQGIYRFPLERYLARNDLSTGNRYFWQASVNTPYLRSFSPSC